MRTRFTRPIQQELSSLTGRGGPEVHCANQRALTIVFGLAAAFSACAPTASAPPPVAAQSPASPAAGSSAELPNGSPGVTAPPLSGRNLLKNATFEGGKSVPWMGLVLPPSAADTDVVGGEFCMTITKPGEHRWDLQLRHREMTIQKGHTYSIQYKARATKPTRAHMKIGMAGPPYTDYWTDDISIKPEPHLYRGTFTMGSNDDGTAEFAFHLGADLITSPLPLTVCIDDVQLDDPQFVRKADQEDMPVAVVRANQLGYLPGLPKTATVKSDSKSPLEWTLVDAKGAKVSSGKTTGMVADAASGESVHIIDFTETKATGKGFKLVVGKDESHPFAIEKDVYKKLKYDALAFFYQSRSGIPIEMPYAGDAKWARKAGHMGDAKTPCAPEAKCDYTLDASGGWYDAGDYGKYVVNGGVSLWVMLNQWERGKLLGKSIADFGDGKLNIPEKKNRVPDLLDEARWELEWMLRMQVPAGQPLAGMAHHKMHDKEWTALGHAPADDTQPRLLQPPSTAATLNLAAVAAQGARVYRDIDKKFSTRCLEVAERAWKAAQAHPDVFAPEHTMGGGPYSDKEVTDEFFWAAAELFITTGNDTYKDFVTKSPHFKAARFSPEGDTTSFSWQRTNALGSLSLAVVPNKLPAADVKAIKDTIAKVADGYLEVASKEGYGQPLPGSKPYIWGSNSSVLNNLLLMGVASDLTRDAKYARGVVLGMDYLLGRNPLDRSYISGYGVRPIRYPHHRFWAPQADPKFPVLPPGIVAGGPNSNLEDGYTKAAGLKGCAPAKCYVDHMEAVSVNEIAINWNAPLAWVAAWLDEKGR